MKLYQLIPLSKMVHLILLYTDESFYNRSV